MNPSSEKQSHIESVPQKKCPLCDSQGSLLFANLSDKIFNVPGSWNIRRCSNSACRIIWLDPKPVDGELSKLYVNYYTHKDSPGKSFSQKKISSKIAQMYFNLKIGYWNLVFGYKNVSLPFFYKYLAALFFLTPGKRLWIDLDVRCLPFVAEGTLLDIGCGNGQWIAFMKTLGWDVSGIDFDKDAIDHCAKKNLKVRAGDLIEQHYPNNFFDAITLSHVIEHLPHPEATLKECYRILKPNGRIIVTTPNAESFGLDFFKGYWRGLEPPRHLQVFSVSALQDILISVGFNVIKCTTHGGRHILYSSSVLKHEIQLVDEETVLPLMSALFVRLLSFIESVYVLFNHRKGELLLAVANK